MVWAYSKKSRSNQPILRSLITVTPAALTAFIITTLMPHTWNTKTSTDTDVGTAAAVLEKVTARLGFKRSKEVEPVFAAIDDTTRQIRERLTTSLCDL